VTSSLKIVDVDLHMGYLCITYKMYKLNVTMIAINSKTYQSINVVNGVSHSHKTANIFFFI